MEREKRGENGERIERWARIAAHGEHEGSGWRDVVCSFVFRFRLVFFGAMEARQFSDRSKESRMDLSMER